MSALRLDWREIFKVTTTLTLQGVLEEHSEVFRDELGVTAKIHVDPEAQPKFHKARPVPSAPRMKVEDELEHLQKLQTIPVFGLGRADCARLEGRWQSVGTLR